MSDYELIWAGIDALTSLQGHLNSRKGRLSTTQKYLAGILPAQIALLTLEAKIHHVWQTQADRVTITCSCGSTARWSGRTARPICPHRKAALDLALAALRNET